MIIKLENFDYINIIEKTGDFTKDVCNLLEINNKNHTKEHVLKVAETSLKLADRFQLNSEICYKAALLHDISAIMNPKDMTLVANKNNMLLDASEQKYPFLLHQRISKLIAFDYFNIKEKDILSSIECHTTLKSKPTKYEMVLFLADKIAWDQAGEPPYLDIIIDGLNISLESACKNYIDYIYDNNKLLYPHKWMNEAHRYFS
ncbi:MAG: bis(5'-nucleosyl)-tetraphosphatase (symmetrical) YqeK [Clostridium sp.]|nr:bis(5'-nucleosyl)-tetraphosphatase (symmetrical) YqeK [Clostridium sp.]MDU7085004.1 bis(5'-nucleosyl)-tetraphosphatase (symmetrical) YqeK [Clostridium sp.]